MNNIKFTFIFLCISSVMFSCKNEIEKTTAVQKKEIKAESKFNIAENSLMCVYDLSDKTTAIVINMNDKEEPTKFDKIFEKIDFRNSISNDYYHATKESKNIYFVDTLGEYKLFKNIEFKNEIKKNVNAKYYVYGTKGFTEMKINDIVIGLDECKTSIIGLTIKNFDTQKNGNPIFCSNRLLKLEYKNDYNKIENLIEKYNNSKNYAYTDNVKTKVFANLDSIYFTYEDDFDWGKHPNKSKCLYPNRAILLLKKNNEIKTLWSDGLDLFGIACD